MFWRQCSIHYCPITSLLSTKLYDKCFSNLVIQRLIINDPTSFHLFTICVSFVLYFTYSWACILCSRVFTYLYLHFFWNQDTLFFCWMKNLNSYILYIMDLFCIPIEYGLPKKKIMVFLDHENEICMIFQSSPKHKIYDQWRAVTGFIGCDPYPFKTHFFFFSLRMTIECWISFNCEYFYLPLVFFF